VARTFVPVPREGKTGGSRDYLPLYDDRFHAGRLLSEELGSWARPELVVGLARGGIQVASEVAKALGAPLDALAVRKVGHPRHAEYATGAVAPGLGAYLRDADVSDQELAEALAHARLAADALDWRLHEGLEPLVIDEKDILLVDDGLETGATMVAAARWARAKGAARVTGAVPVAAVRSVDLVERTVDELVCLHVVRKLGAVAHWYWKFDQVDDEQVRALLAAARRPAAEALVV
jgi:putative phosphoribosyl transferase